MVEKNLILVKLEDIHRISRPEEERLEQGLDLGMAPVLAEDVGGILVAIDMVEGDDLCSDSLTHTVKGQGRVPLVELEMRDGRAVDNAFVITKHVALVPDGNSEIVQGVAQVKDLFDTGTTGDEF